MLLITDKWQTWLRYSFCYGKGLCFSFTRVTVMSYIHKTELMCHCQNVLSLHCFCFPSWNLNNLPLKGHKSTGKPTQQFMILYNREHDYNWITTNCTAARRIVFSQGIGYYTRLTALCPFRSTVAFKSTTFFQDVPNPVSEHHASCKCSGKTLVSCISVRNAQKWDAIHSVIFHFWLTETFFFVTFMSPIATSLPAEQLTEIASER